MQIRSLRQRLAGLITLLLCRDTNPLAIGGNKPGYDYPGYCAGARETARRKRQMSRKDTATLQALNTYCDSDFGYGYGGGLN